MLWCHRDPNRVDPMVHCYDCLCRHLLFNRWHSSRSYESFRKRTSHRLTTHDRYTLHPKILYPSRHQISFLGGGGDGGPRTKMKKSPGRVETAKNWYIFKTFWKTVKFLKKVSPKFFVCFTCCDLFYILNKPLVDFTKFSVKVWVQKIYLNPRPPWQGMHPLHLHLKWKWILFSFVLGSMFAHFQ